MKPTTIVWVCRNPNYWEDHAKQMATADDGYEVEFLSTAKAGYDRTAKAIGYHVTIISPWIESGENGSENPMFTGSELDMGIQLAEKVREVNPIMPMVILGTSVIQPKIAKRIGKIKAIALAAGFPPPEDVLRAIDYAQRLAHP